MPEVAEGQPAPALDLPTDGGGRVSLAALKKVIEQSDFRDAGLAQNLTALERGYEETTVHTLERRLTA